MISAVEFEIFFFYLNSLAAALSLILSLFTFEDSGICFVIFVGISIFSAYLLCTSSDSLPSIGSSYRIPPLLCDDFDW